MTGLLVIISSPSGGGKDVVINTLLKHLPDAVRLITTTSRPPRPGNKEGVDYFFTDRATFEARIKNNEFLEHNEYAGNLYGTPKQYLADLLAGHKVVLTQIEVNGKHIFDKLGVPHLAIFMLPDSLDNLRKRIEKRGGITPEVIDQRLEIAKHEIAASTDYDYRVVNVEGQLAETIAKIEGIITQELANRTTLDKTA